MGANTCVECHDAITNPICSHCLAERIRLVVEEKNPKLAQNIVGYHIDGDTKCIFCTRTMGLCAHCFSRDTYLFLEDNDANLAQEFLTHFDFELRKEFV